MFGWLKKTLKIHEHNYLQVSFRQVYGSECRYSIRKYRCQTCKKEVEVDGRRDHIGGY